MPKETFSTGTRRPRSSTARKSMPRYSCGKKSSPGFVPPGQRGQGRKADQAFPHPDDIVIDPERGVRFIGPLDQAEQDRLEETLRMRDLLILQYALDRRLCDWDEGADPLDKPTSALAIALNFNDHVPERYRYDDARLTFMMSSATSRSKRELLKAVYAGWRELGASPRRGKTLPKPRVMMQQIAAVMEAVKMLDAEASRISI